MRVDISLCLSDREKIRFFSNLYLFKIPQRPNKNETISVGTMQSQSVYLKMKKVSLKGVIGCPFTTS